MKQVTRKEYEVALEAAKAKGSVNRPVENRTTGAKRLQTMIGAQVVARVTTTPNQEPKFEVAV